MPTPTALHYRNPAPPDSDRQGGPTARHVTSFEYPDDSWPDMESITFDLCADFRRNLLSGTPVDGVLRLPQEQQWEMLRTKKLLQQYRVTPVVRHRDSGSLWPHSWLSKGADL